MSGRLHVGRREKDLARTKNSVNSLQADNKLDFSKSKYSFRILL
jgi:hypothetical protein